MAVHLRGALYVALLTLLSGQVSAGEIYTFGIVPQDSAGLAAKEWTPILKYLEERTGKQFQFATTRSIPLFSQRVAESKYDFVYMNPNDYIKYQDKDRYRAIARARNFKLKGIIVVRKDSPLEKLDELNNKDLAVPANAFASDTLARAALHGSGLAVTISPLATSDAVYRAVALGHATAGGGMLRTFNNAAPEYREQLRVLWTSEGYTAQAFAAHSRVPNDVVQAVQEALIDLSDDPLARKYLKTIAPEGLDYGRDEDWDDVRKLDL
ncbi:MAG: phosphate/phosphite/phosphonate ABC transporter substrate-binding protein [Gammaproteobacteria bacterium]|nr:phosphate/phosphite/phosphonate ABC transporter substrate-binding protein [Gammaproteobacteria bacterium]